MPKDQYMTATYVEAIPLSGFVKQKNPQHREGEGGYLALASRRVFRLCGLSKKHLTANGRLILDHGWIPRLREGDRPGGQCDGCLRHDRVGGVV